MHVIIIGAGLGGLTLAQTFRKQGISFEIFERDTDRDSRFQGWAIALHTMLDKFVGAMPSDLGDLREATNHLAPLDLPAEIVSYFPGKEDRLGWVDSAETPLIRAERYRLRNWLSKNLPIQWGKHLSHFEQDDNGVTAYFEDGSSAKGDILVGADGIKSAVRQQLLQTPHEELLKVVPIAAILGEVTLTDDACKRHLELGHSCYTVLRPELGFVTFTSLHDMFPDGKSAKYYWFFMQQDPKIGDSDHWLHTATQQEQLDYVLKSTEKLAPKFREIFQLTPASGIRIPTHIWRDLELPSLPAGRVILQGDSVHAMAPFRGEGGYHTILDALSLSKTLTDLNKSGGYKNIDTVKASVEEYNAEMLERGKRSVQFSRASYVDAKKKAEDRPQFAAPIKLLTERKVVLGVSA